MLSDAGAVTVTRPIPSAPGGPKCTRPMVSGSGAVRPDPGSVSPFFAHAGAAASDSASAARSALLDGRRDLFSPLRDVIRRGDVLEGQYESGIAGVLVGDEVVGVDPYHPDEGALRAFTIGARRRRPQAVLPGGGDGEP